MQALSNATVHLSVEVRIGTPDGSAIVRAPVLDLSPDVAAALARSPA